MRVDTLLFQLGEFLLAQPTNVEFRALPILLVPALRRRVVAARVFPAGDPAETGLRLCGVYGVDRREAVRALDLLFDGCAFDDARRAFDLKIAVCRLEILLLLWSFVLSWSRSLLLLFLLLLLLLLLPLLRDDVR